MAGARNAYRRDWVQTESAPSGAIVANNSGIPYDKFVAETNPGRGAAGMSAIHFS